MDKKPMSSSEVLAALGGLLPEFWLRSPVGMCLTDDRGVIVAVNT